MPKTIEIQSEETEKKGRDNLSLHDWGGFIALVPVSLRGFIIEANLSIVQVWNNESKIGKSLLWHNNFPIQRVYKPRF